MSATGRTASAEYKFQFVEVLDSHCPHNYISATRPLTYCHCAGSAVFSFKFSKKIKISVISGI
jgi:hypothetical protein